MQTTAQVATTPTVRPLSDAEISDVAGGVMPTVDVTGMPDRTVMCGTMWILDRLMKTFGPQPR